MRLLSGLNDSGHTDANRERFTMLAAGYFQHYGVTSRGEIRTRLAHALSAIRVMLMPDDLERSRLFLRTWVMPKNIPTTPPANPAKSVKSTDVKCADVFLSYAREDRDAVRFIATQLEASDLSVWWDEDLQTGGRWESEIRHRIDNAGAVMVVWSGFSSVSEWVRTEAALGRDQRKLIPVFLRKCRLPTAFADLHTTDLSEWDGEPNYAEWLKVVEAAKSAVLKVTI